jgi:hypothetical protein
MITKEQIVENCRIVDENWKREEKIRGAML